MGIRDLTPWGWPRSTPEAREEHPLRSLQCEVDRIFDDFFRGFDIAPFRGLRGQGALSPKVDAAETEKN